MDTAPTAPTTLRALARKYRTLAALRRARAAGAAPPARDVFVVLSREFPGALRELETVRLGELDARADALERAAAGAPVAPWMLYVAAYHAWMRAALWLKPRRARGSPLDPAAIVALTAAVAAHARLPVDAAFVRAVAAPPGGRLSPVVLARVAEAHGAALAAVRAAVYAPRSVGPDDAP